MLRAQRVHSLRGRAVEHRGHGRGRIAADVVEAPEAGRGGDEEGDGVRAPDQDGVAGGDARAALRQDPHSRLEPQCAGHGLPVRGGAAAVAIDASHHEIAVGGRLDRRALQRRQARFERDPAVPARGQVHDDHLVGRAGEDLARERDVANRVGDARGGGGEIEIAPVGLDDVRRRRR